jgi:hypothetical protein
MAAVGALGQGPRGGATWFVVGRLQSAATFNDAQTELRAIAARLADLSPAAERNRSVAVVPLGLYIVGPESRLALWMLGVAACIWSDSA